MKRFIIALLICSFTASAIAKYAVYDMQLRATTLTDVDGRGKEIVNGVKNSTEAYLKKVHMLKSYLVVDEENGWQSHLIIEKGYMGQHDAEMMSHMYKTNSVMVVDMPGKPRRYAMKGTSITLVFLEVNAGDEFNPIMVMLAASVVGAWSESEMEVLRKGELSSIYKYSYSGTGSGIGSEELWTESFPINSMRIRFNSKLSYAMAEAYFDAGGPLNEVAGVMAAEDVINQFINKKAKIDDADFDLPLSM